jgi:hypothetical protein
VVSRKAPLADAVCDYNKSNYCIAKLLIDISSSIRGSMLAVETFDCGHATPYHGEYAGGLGSSHATLYSPSGKEMLDARSIPDRTDYQKRKVVQ